MTTNDDGGGTLAAPLVIADDAQCKPIAKHAAPATFATTIDLTNVASLSTERVRVTLRFL